MQDLTLEYIAGFVDGEGSFTITKTHVDSYRPQFSIGNTNLQILQNIRKFFRITTKLKTTIPKNPRRATFYELAVSNLEQCKSIACQLLPYLRIKQQQAAIIMQFPRAYPTYIRGRTYKDYSTYALVLKLRNKIVALNKTGPPDQESNAHPQLEPDPQLSLFQHKGRR